MQPSQNNPPASLLGKRTSSQMQAQAVDPLKVIAQKDLKFLQDLVTKEIRVLPLARADLTFGITMIQNFLQNKMPNQLGQCLIC